MKGCEIDPGDLKVEYYDEESGCGDEIVEVVDIVFPRKGYGNYVHDPSIHPKYYATAGGKVIGFLFLKISGKEITTTLIGVLPEYRMTGVANTMSLHAMKDLGKRYRGYRVVGHIRVSNTPSREFSKKIGFVEKEILEGYYSNGEDAVEIELKL